MNIFFPALRNRPKQGVAAESLPTHLKMNLGFFRLAAKILPTHLKMKLFFPALPKQGVVAKSLPTHLKMNLIFSGIAEAGV